jgi:hypothetical protein
MIYNIIIELTNGDEANCRVEASNQLEALDRIKASKEFVDFVGNNDISKFTIKKAQEQPCCGNYILQKSSDRPNHYVVTDKANSTRRNKFSFSKTFLIRTRFVSQRGYEKSEIGLENTTTISRCR